MSGGCEIWLKLLAQWSSLHPYIPTIWVTFVGLVRGLRDMARMLDAQNVWPWLEFAHHTEGYAFVVAKVRRALAHVSAAASPGSNGGCQDN